MRRPPYTRQWRDTPPSVVASVYTDCPEAWARAGREVAQGYPSTLIPDDLPLSECDLSMLAGRDIYIIDLADTDRDRIRDIGEAVIRAGAHAAVYLGDPVLFFWPRGQQEAA